jgi:hypothetical protein
LMVGGTRATKTSSRTSAAATMLSSLWAFSKPRHFWPPRSHAGGSRTVSLANLMNCQESKAQLLEVDRKCENQTRKQT